MKIVTSAHGLASPFNKSNYLGKLKFPRSTSVNYYGGR